MQIAEPTNTTQPTAIVTCLKRAALSLLLIPAKKSETANGTTPTTSFDARWMSSRTVAADRLLFGVERWSRVAGA